MIRPLRRKLLSTPSSMKLFDCSRLPFENSSVPGRMSSGLVPLPIVPDAEYPTPVTPGPRIASWAKFRPFSGRSLTAFVSITCPTDDVFDSSSGAEACTSTVSVTSPAVSVKSICAI